MFDIHSHILPNVDDGSPDIETSLLLCHGLAELGFKGVYATSHIINDTYPNTEIQLKNSFQILKEEIEKKKINLKIGLAAEYFLDETVLTKINQDIQLLTFPNKGLLVEFSYSQQPEKITELTFPVQLQEYTLVLAHPERYNYWQGNMVQYERLKDIGFAFQINALSLTEYYGKQVKDAANQLLKAGMIDYVGTDIHHERHLNALLKYFGKTGIQDLIQTHSLKNNQFEIA
jgi:tyrosine-protein phosphatase YwqE